MGEANVANEQRREEAIEAVDEGARIQREVNRRVAELMGGDPAVRDGVVARLRGPAETKHPEYGTERDRNFPRMVFYFQISGQRRRPMLVLIDCSKLFFGEVNPAPSPNLRRAIVDHWAARHPMVVATQLPGCVIVVTKWFCNWRGAVTHEVRIVGITLAENLRNVGSGVDDVALMRRTLRRYLSDSRIREILSRCTATRKMRITARTRQMVADYAGWWMHLGLSSDNIPAGAINARAQFWRYNTSLMWSQINTLRCGGRRHGPFVIFRKLFERADEVVAQQLRQRPGIADGDIDAA